MQSTTSHAFVSRTPPLEAICTPINPKQYASSRFPTAVLTNVPALSMSDTEIIELCNAEWEDLLAPFDQFAARFDFTDASACSMDELASLIVDAPHPAIAHALGEIALCRRQTGKLQECDYSESEFASDVIERAVVAARTHLAEFPVYNAWISNIDRFTCSKSILLLAIRRAPDPSVRQSLREVYCYRATLALIVDTHHFA